MQIQTQIETLLASLSPSYLLVENESHKHNVPINSSTHFKVIIVSEAFIGLSLIKRHQKIYALLNPLMQNPIHALALNTLTHEEWILRQEQEFTTPNCLGAER